MCRIKTLVVALSIILSPNFLHAKVNHDVNQLINKIDSVLLSRKKQRISYNWSSQPVNTKKIFRAKVNLIVDKTNVNEDSLGNFIFEDIGFYHQIFIDTNLYFVNNDKYLIEAHNLNRKDYENSEGLVRRNCLPLLRSFIRNNSHPSGLPFTYAHKFACDSILNGKNLIYLCFVDSSENLTYDSIEVWIDKQFNYYRIKNTYLDNLATESAFREFDQIAYSDDIPHSPKEFLDSLLKSKYPLVYNNPESEKEKENGDTIVTKLSFSLINGSSQEFSLDKLSSRFVVIEFANINCPYCFKTIPFYNELSNNKAISVFWIDSNDGEQKDYAEEIFRKKKLKFTVLYDDDKSILNQYKVNLFPTTFIIDRQSNRITKRIDGYTDNLDQIIKDLINAQ